MSVAPDLPDYFSLIQALREDAARIGNDFGVHFIFLAVGGGATATSGAVVPAGETWLVTLGYLACRELTATPPQAGYGEVRNATTVVRFVRFAFVAGDGKITNFTKPFLALAGQNVTVEVTNCGGAPATYQGGFAGYRV